MIEHAFALLGAVVAARFAFHEIRWRFTRDESGNCGRFGHFTENERIR